MADNVAILLDEVRICRSRVDGLHKTLDHIRQTTADPRVLQAIDELKSHDRELLAMIDEGVDETAPAPTPAPMPVDPAQIEPAPAA